MVIERQSAEDELKRVYRGAVADGFNITEQWIRNRKGEGDNLFGGFYRNCDEADDYYDGEYPMDVPDGGSDIRLRDIKASINIATAQLTHGGIDIGVPPRGPQGDADAERVERYLENTHAGLELRCPTDEQTLMATALYGIAWKKITANIEALANIPSFQGDDHDRGARRAYANALTEEMERVGAEFPFVSDWIDPREMSWDFASHNPRWVMWTHRVDATWIAGTFPEWRPSDDATAGAQYIEMTEVWTKNQVAYFADDKFVMSPRFHPLGRVPFVKYEARYTRQIKERTPEYMYRGVGYGAYDLITAKSRLLNTHIDINNKAAWQPIDIYGIGPQAEHVQDTYDTQPDARNVIPPHLRVERGENSEAPFSLRQAKDMVDEELRDVLFSNVTGADGTSGHQISLLQGLASLILTTTKNAFERGKVDENELLLRYVELVLKRTVSSFGSIRREKQMAKIAPKDIRGHYFTTVVANADTPDEMERKLRLGMEMNATGFVDHETALRMAGIARPQEVVNRVRVERLLASDPATLALVQELLPRIGLISQQFAATGDDEGAAQAAQLEADIAASLGLGEQSQGVNLGQFGAGNQAGVTPNTPGAGIPGTAGGPESANLVARQRQVRPGSGDRVPVG